MRPEHSPDRNVAMPIPLGCTSLENLCADVADAVAGPLSRRDQRVAAALAPYLGLTDLLDDSACRCSPERYLRHLLCTGTDYTILALVWRPRQMSPVHAHQTWCAFGVHRGWMVETFFAPGPLGVEPRGCVQRWTGDGGHAPAGPDAVHRLANLGTETAISIHVYGAPYDRLGDQVNQIWAD
jgi:predicted metal-dependent enzyme (double-stranded beta helix superfamily)